MNKFRFRLQRILDYRTLQEEWAKDAYLEAKATRIKAEGDKIQTEKKREIALAKGAISLEERRDLEAYIARLEDEIADQAAVIAILLQEEDKAHAEWLDARRNKEALEKLHDAAKVGWQKQSDLEETKLLDDWTSTRRSA